MAINEADILSQMDIGVKRDPVNNAVVIAINTVTREHADLARKLILEQSKSKSGTTAQSIGVMPVQTTAYGFTIEVVADEAAEFIDKGVNGIERGWNSPYTFKFPKPSKAHQEKILSWIPSAGLFAREGQTYDSMAWAIAAGVKKKGLEPKPFLEKSFGPEFEEDMRLALSVAIGRAVQIHYQSFADKINSQNGGND